VCMCWMSIVTIAQVEHSKASNAYPCLVLNGSPTRWEVANSYHLKVDYMILPHSIGEVNLVL